MLAGKQFNRDGSLFSPIDERVSLYGDVITVNGGMINRTPLVPI
jgi:hypothetical protein